MFYSSATHYVSPWHTHTLSPSFPPFTLTNLSRPSQHKSDTHHPATWLHNKACRLAHPLTHCLCVLSCACMCAGLCRCVLSILSCSYLIEAHFISADGSVINSLWSEWWKRLCLGQLKESRGYALFERNITPEVCNLLSILLALNINQDICWKWKV